MNAIRQPLPSRIFPSYSQRTKMCFCTSANRDQRTSHFRWRQKHQGPVCCPLHIKQPKWFKLLEPSTRVCLMIMYHRARLHKLLAFDRSATLARHVHTVVPPTAMAVYKEVPKQVFRQSLWPLVARSSKLVDSRSGIPLQCLYTSLRSTDSWIPHLNCGAPCTSTLEHMKYCSKRQCIQHLCNDYYGGL